MGDPHMGMMVTPSVKLVRPLGEGGMGSVWVADHLALRTQVVVKFIADDLKSSKEAHDRFSREAAAAAQVKSPHVVQTFDHGLTDAGVPYIVMELLEGRDLGAVLEQTPRLAPDLVVEILAQLARALDKAHDKGIVHRDIKPGNIFLCDASKGELFVKLLDFGIAKGVEVPRIDSHTKTGSMIGSPFYMSPEQILGAKGVDHRSDLWSVGVVAFEALTGTKPFDAETMGGLAIKIHAEPLPLLSTLAPGVPAAVDAWFQRACARKGEERYSSAKEMVEALAAAVGGQMPKSVDVPRVTGSADVSARAPTFVAGASTDAGVVRTSTKPSSTQGRVLLLLGIVAFIGGGAFVGSRLIFPKKDPHALVPEPSSAATKEAPAASPMHLTHTSAPATAASTPLAEAEAPPPSSAPSAQPAAPIPKAGAHVAKPRPKESSHTSSVARPLASQASPTTTVQPAPSGHDIF